MSIDSSVFKSRRKLNGGYLDCVEIHTDHTGLKHRFSYRVPDTVDVDAVMAARAVNLVGSLEINEKASIAQRIEKGEDPATITPDHITGGEALRVVLETAMKMEAAHLFLVATFIGTLSDAQLDNVFNPTIRAKIRARAASVLALKTDLEADQALEEEING